MTAFVGSVSAFLRWKAKNILDLKSVRCAHPGAVPAIQRTSSHLAINPHFYSLVSDGVFVEKPDGTTVFRELPVPTDYEVTLSSMPGPPPKNRVDHGPQRHPSHSPVRRSAHGRTCPASGPFGRGVLRPLHGRMTLAGRLRTCRRPADRTMPTWWRPDQRPAPPADPSSASTYRPSDPAATPRTSGHTRNWGFIQAMLQLRHELSGRLGPVGTHPLSGWAARVAWHGGRAVRSLRRARRLREVLRDLHGVRRLQYSPQLIETDDFLTFNIATLNGSAAQNKGISLFPRKIAGKHMMLSRKDREDLHLVSSK